MHRIISCFFHNYDIKIMLVFTRFHTWDTKIRVFKKKMLGHVHESNFPFMKLIQCQFNSAGMFFQTATRLLLFIVLQNNSDTKGLCVCLLH